MFFAITLFYGESGQVTSKTIELCLLGEKNHTQTLLHLSSDINNYKISQLSWISVYLFEESPFDLHITKDHLYAAFVLSSGSW